MLQEACQRVNTIKAIRFVKVGKRIDLKAARSRFRFLLQTEDVSFNRNLT